MTDQVSLSLSFFLSLTLSLSLFLSLTKEQVRERRVPLHVGHPIVHDDHDEGRDPADEENVQEGENRLPPLGPQVLAEVPHLAVETGEAQRGGPGQRRGRCLPLVCDGAAGGGGDGGRD